MNIVLFEKDEIERSLPLADERARHILKVLRRKVGDSLDVGLLDGPRGKARVERIGEKEIVLTFEWGRSEEELMPIDLIVGLSRPQTNRKILQEATALGARSMRFVTTERGEASYAESKLWSTGEWRRHVVEGVAQAFSTRRPEVKFGMSLEEALRDLDGARTKWALDNYEAAERLGKVDTPNLEEGVALAIGSERGWTGRERDFLRGNGYTLMGLGKRVLRTETAVVSAVAVVLSRM